MSPRDWQVRIEDILDAISAIQQYTAGMTFEDFAADNKTVDAVLHNIVVIGEAARSVPQEVVERRPDVPWDKMKAIRNVVVHVYFGIRKKILWDTVQVNLPPLAPLLRRLLEESN